ncbi:DUF2269 domain-containing protein [Shimazuella alba]|uniref:DUF2269 domain-containing protein n=1 Tax=Shimazuella alba TaxID=2690964 RepID=A0A6I4W386_9BACL|nr:DUF2269 domain-containing protein [Shimazuella alba]MXQ54752.1 DUF2269 domain-containing protein [Shimazuella alba]
MITELFMGLLWTLLLIILLTVPILILGKKKVIKLNAKQKRWWVIFHVLFVMIYFTGVLAIVCLSIFAMNTTDRALINAAHFFMYIFDFYLIVPGALGSLITGVWLAIGTWGLITYYWIIVKWIGNLTTILFGSTFIGYWIHVSFQALFHKGIDPAKNIDFLANQRNILLGIFIILGILVFLTAISYLKPWGKRFVT